MKDDLNTFIAEKMMGESKPAPPDELFDVSIPVLDREISSDGGAWVVDTDYYDGDVPRWFPNDFSSNFNLAYMAFTSFSQRYDTDVSFTVVLKGNTAHNNVGVDIDVGERWAGSREGGSPAKALCLAMKEVIENEG